MNETAIDGVIKFDCQWTPSAPLVGDEIDELIKWRNEIFKAGLIGAYEGNIGFGNLSVRSSEGSFIISGSGTGIYSIATEEHFTRVTSFDVHLNRACCQGPLRASSESMTHGMIYALDPAIGAIVHGHNRILWEKLMELNYPTTPQEIAYGTTEMANAVLNLYQTTELFNLKIFVTRGHEEGIFAFDQNLSLATQKILAALSLL